MARVQFQVEAKNMIAQRLKIVVPDARERAAGGARLRKRGESKSRVNAR